MGQHGEARIVRIARTGTVGRDAQRGTWWWRVMAYDEQGRQRPVRRRGFRTKAEALDAMAEWRESWAPADARGAVPTLTEWAATWLARMERRNLSPATKAQHRWIWEQRIAPYPIARMRLDEVETHHVSAWLDGLLEQPKRRQTPGGPVATLSPASANKARIVAKMIMDAAVADGWIGESPVDRAIRPTRGVARASERPVWTFEELAVAMRLWRQDRQCRMWHLVAATGIRRAELAGLTWGAVDLEAGTITISEVLIQARNAEGDMPHVRKAPKTAAGRRVIDLDAGTVELLRVHRTEQMRIGLEVGARWVRPDQPVFRRDSGRPWIPNSLTPAWRAWLAHHAGTHGLPLITLHDLRHTHATHLIAAGVPLPVVAARLGHASGSFTAHTYLHGLAGAGASAARAVADHVAAAARATPELDRLARARPDVTRIDAHHGM